MSFTCKGVGAPQAEVDSKLQIVEFKRRKCGDNDVHIKILKASVCHSDIHTVRQEWGPQKGLQIPGHEIFGQVVEAGKNVSNAKVGDYVAVGCMVGAKCLNEETNKLTCCSCVQDKDERFCEKGQIGTYSSPDVVDGVECVTYGGYSTDIVVNSNFIVHVPEFYQKEENQKYAPAIACAGITLYSPLKRAGAGPGKKVAINGIGGLGMFGVSIAKALGAEVYALTRSESKKADLEAMGVKVIMSTNPEEMELYKRKLDIIVDTVSADHDINALLSLIKPKGTMAIVGGVPEPLKLATFALIMGDINLIGSLIGTIQDTQEVYNLCAANQVCVPVEIVEPEDLNDAWDRVVASQVKYRIVINIDSLRK
eukprot:UN00257